MVGSIDTAALVDIEERIGVDSDWETTGIDIVGTHRHRSCSQIDKRMGIVVVDLQLHRRQRLMYWVIQLGVLVVVAANELVCLSA